MTREYIIAKRYKAGDYETVPRFDTTEMNTVVFDRSRFPACVVSKQGTELKFFPRARESLIKKIKRIRK